MDTEVDGGGVDEAVNWDKDCTIFAIVLGKDPIFSFATLSRKDFAGMYWSDAPWKIAALSSSLLETSRAYGFQISHMKHRAGVFFFLKMFRRSH